LAANSCVERLGVPVFLWGREEGGLIKGSCRAPEGFDVVEILRSLPEGVLTQLGGHTAAGGFAVSQDEIHRFPELIVDAVSKIKRAEPEPVWIEGRLAPEDITSVLYNEIRKLAPFGEGNRQPLFLVEGSVELVKPFGKSGGHIEIHIRGINKTIKAIRFFADRDEHMKNITTGQPIQAIVTIERSTFGWKPELRLRLVDVIRPGSLISTS
jgi:single-stranded-DNA-specific exonuclease